MPQEIASISTGGESQTDLLNMTDFSHLFRDSARNDLRTGELLKGAKPRRCDYMYYNNPYTLNFEWLLNIDFSNVVTTANMLGNSKGAVNPVLPKLETGNVKTWNSFISGCIDLITIEGLDLNSATNVSSMLYQTKKLENLTLYNIRISIQIGGGNYYSNVLTVESLVHTIRELCKVSSATLTIGADNLAKIADLYCKVLDSEDEKMPFELCESTEDGAMLITEYALLKGWNIA
jgi:hypothetical protein